MSVSVSALASVVCVHVRACAREPGQCCALRGAHACACVSPLGLQAVVRHISSEDMGPRLTKLRVDVGALANRKPGSAEGWAVLEDFVLITCCALTVFDALSAMPDEGVRRLLHLLDVEDGGARPIMEELFM